MAWPDGQRWEVVDSSLLDALQLQLPCRIWDVRAGHGPQAMIAARRRQQLYCQPMQVDWCHSGDTACGLPPSTRPPPAPDWDCQCGECSCDGLTCTALPMWGGEELIAASAIGSTLPDGHPALTPHASYVKDEERGWTYGHHPGLTPALQKQLEGMLVERVGVFAYSMSDMPGYSGEMGEFHIELTHDRPIFEGPRRFSPLEREVQDKKCDEMHVANIIGPAGSSKYACNPTMPAKKDADGNWTDVRYCIDFRPINRDTAADKYGLHLPEDLFRDMDGSTVFSVLDLRSGFMQLPVAFESQAKTAFWWRNQLWAFKRMPFGLRNASAWFQRVLDFEIAGAGLGHCAKAFIDDVCIHSPTPEQHIKDVAAVLDMLMSCGLRVHPEKSVFGAAVVQYLGHNVCADGLTPQKAKVQAVKEMRAPLNVSELRAVLGFLGYYRCYVPEFSRIAQPMNALLADGVKWQWGAEQQQALDALRAELCTPGKVLRQYDPSRPVFVHTDWSKQGISGVLGQKDDEGNEFLVACVSRSLNKHERNYSSYEGEMLAACWAIKTFRPYLMGVPFTLITDHQPLKWLMENKELTGKHARWALSLMDYTFTVEHRPGVKHQNADVLSRFPLPDCTDGTGARLDEELPAAAAAVAGEWGRPTGLAAALSLLTPTEAQLGPSAADWQLLQACMASDWDREPSPHSVWGSDDLLAGNLGLLADAATAGLDGVPWAEHKQQCLAEQAWQWVQNACMDGALPSDAPIQALDCTGEPDAWGVRAVKRLSTSPVPAEFYTAALVEGIVLYEPFGGLCAGLEMVLRCGLRVRRYLYSDTDPAARAVAKHRVQSLAQQYPGQLAADAFIDMFVSLPQDVRRVGTAELVQAGARDPAAGWWMVVAGWECQDLSPAGGGKGLAGPKSSTFYDVLRIVGALQQLQPQRPPAFVIENTAMQFNFTSERVRTQDWPAVVHALGESVVLDAARVGSHAHRLRNYWLNLAPARQLRHVFSAVQRPAGGARLMGEVLNEGRQAMPVEHPTKGEFYPANVVGQPRVVLPTLVAYPQSRAFTPAAPGSLWDDGLQMYVEPCPDERERVLGYDTGCTAAPGVTEAQRHAITGRCMDSYAMQSLLAVAIALRLRRGELLDSLASSTQRPKNLGVGTLPPPPPGYTDFKLTGDNSAVCAAWTSLLRQGWLPGSGLGRRGQGPLEPVPAVGWSARRGSRPGIGAGPVPVLPLGAALVPPPAAAVVGPVGPASPQAEPAAQYGEPRPEQEVLQSTARLELLACLAEQAESPAVQADMLEVWEDDALLSYLQSGEWPAGADAALRKRLSKRSQYYVWEREQLFRKMADGSVRVVPPPASRHQLVVDTHVSTGHWGEKRTLSLLLSSYWWRGVLEDVRRVVRSCESCDKARAVFNARLPALQPLPIMGLFYRWGVDLAGPFPRTERGNLYVMICIEHFSKHVELVPLASKEPSSTASAFRSRVLCRYGAMAEVLTDSGGEFDGAFDQLLAQALVDHRRTSKNRPESDGLAERAVQSIKRALRRRCQDTKVGVEWDEDLPWVMLGYNCSAQASTGFSPYELMHAQQPTVPPAVKPRFDEVIDLDDAAEAERQLLARAELMRRNCVTAGQNLAIAQHRDTLRYARVRGGDYQPRQHKFEVGDFVYVRRSSPEGLHMRVRPPIYRIKQIKASGVVTLQGKCGGTQEHHLVSLTPCHLANIDPTIDVTLQRPDADLACQVCGHQDDEAEMLLCDSCGTGWHCFCLVPPLLGVPEGLWICPPCDAKGVTPEEVQARIDAQKAQLRAPGPQEVDTGSKARRRAAALLRQAADAKQLDGRLVSKKVRKAGTRQWVPQVGQLKFMGEDSGPHFFVVEFADGSKESMQLPTAEKYLLPPDAVMPASAAAVLLPELLTTLPAKWELQEPAVLRQALQRLMPGAWDSRAVSRLSGQLAAAQSAAAAGGRELQCIATAPEELAWLLSRVELRDCAHILEPFNGTGAISSALRAVGHRVLTNDLSLARPADLHLDALQPGFYTTVARQLAAPIDAIVTSPWFAVLDIVLPLLVAAARVVVCVHVPGHYVSSGVEPRHQYLRQLQREGRLLVLFGLPRAATGWRCAWLVIFRSAALKRQLLKSGWRHGGLALC